MLSKFKGLAIEGGGMAGLAYMGAISKFIDAGYTIEQFTAFAGSSAGSIVAGLMAVRADIGYMSKKLRETNFSKFMDGSWTYFGDMWRVYNRYGWYKGETLRTWYKQCMHEITGNGDITFAQIKEKYKTHLIITKVDVLYPRSKLVIMDHTTHPDTSIADAVHCSCSIPYFFQAVNGSSTTELQHIYVDGGVLLNYPITTLYSILKPEEVMGLCLTNKDEEETEQEESRPVRNHAEFIQSITKTWYYTMTGRHIHKNDWKRTCNIEVSVKSTDFDLKDTVRDELYTQGWNAMYNFLRKQV